MAKVTYKEPKSYFNAEMLKEAKAYDKEKAKKTTTKKTAKKTTKK